MSIELEHFDSEIQGFHAHIYYDPDTRQEADWVKEHIAQHFPAAKLGVTHEAATGVHTKPMFQIKFGFEEFGKLVPWLTMNHQGLSVLIHPDAETHELDYLKHSLWLGEQLPLRMEMMVR